MPALPPPARCAKRCETSGIGAEGAHRQWLCHMLFCRVRLMPSECSRDIRQRKAPPRPSRQSGTSSDWSVARQCPALRCPRRMCMRGANPAGRVELSCRKAQATQSAKLLPRRAPSPFSLSASLQCCAWLHPCRPLCRGRAKCRVWMCVLGTGCLLRALCKGQGLGAPHVTPPCRRRPA